MPGKKITDLDIYDDINTDKSKRDLFEVSKNTGTYASPTYATDGSRKISVEQLKETLNIKDYLVRDFVAIGSGGTILEDKVNAIIVSADTSFTLPTADSSNYGKSLVVVNRSTYTVTVNGIVNGTSIKLTNFNETIQLSCLFDGVSTYGWWLISDAITDKICSNLITLIASTYVANPNDSIRARPQINSTNINITINPGVEGQCIYIKNQSVATGNTYTVNLIGYYSHSLSAEEWVLIRYFGAEWEVIATNQNSGGTSDDIVNNSTVSGATVTDALDSLQNDIDTIPTPTLDTVTDVGNTTTNSITVGDLVVNHPSGSGVAVNITKGGNEEGLKVHKTSGSGNVATITGGKTLISELDLTTPLADSEIASASTWNAKLGGTITNNTIPKGNGAGGLIDSIITEVAGVVTIAGSFISSAITGGTVNANNILRVPVLATDTVTVLNGSLWYNTASNLFKGFVNGIVVTFMTSRMPANTVKTNNTSSTADAVDLALTTETVLGRTASVNSGNIAPIPIQVAINAETTLVAGTRTITDSRVTANTVIYVTPSNTGTLTQQIRYTKNVGTSIVFTAGGSDTCTFSYWIIF